MTKTTDCGASGQSAGVTGTIPAFDLQRAQTLDSKQARSSASVKTRFPFFHHCVTLRFVISGELLDDTTQATSVFYDNQAEQDTTDDKEYQKDSAFISGLTVGEKFANEIYSNIKLSRTNELGHITSDVSLLHICMSDIQLSDTYL